MQIVQAGSHQVLFLDLDPELLRQGVSETGFSCELTDTPRSVVLELEAPERENPLLLFDASDPANTGWFSRCQFYVDGRTGAVMQTPFIIANRQERSGKPATRSVGLQIRKELPAHFHLPGKQPVSEKVVYSVLFSFLNALQQVGVGVCGSGVVRPLAGRSDAPR